MLRFRFYFKTGKLLFFLMCVFQLFFFCNNIFAEEKSKVIVYSFLEGRERKFSLQLKWHKKTPLLSRYAIKLFTINGKELFASEHNSNFNRNTFIEKPITISLPKNIEDKNYVLFIYLYDKQKKHLFTEKTGVLKVQNKGNLISFIPYKMENYAYPPEITEWDEMTKLNQIHAGKKIISALRKAIKNGMASFSIPKGHYRFKSKVVLDNIKNMTINGNGSTFWLTKLNSRGVVFVNCENMKLANLYIDRDPLPYVQGKITKIENEKNKIRLRIDPGFAKSNAFFLPENYSGKYILRILVFENDDNNGLRLKRSWEVGHTQYKPLVSVGNKEYETSFASYSNSPRQAGMEIGDKIAIVSRLGFNHDLVFLNCRNMEITNISIYTGGTFGLVESYSKSKSKYLNCRIIRRPNTRRLVSSNADAFHFHCPMEGPDIVNCEIEASGDDSIAIHGYNSFIIDVLSSKKIILGMRGDMTPTFKVGTAIDLYNFFSFKLKGTSVITGINKIQGTELVEEARKLKEKIMKKYFLVNFSPTIFYEVELQSALSLQKGDYAVHKDYVGNNYKIKENFIYNCAGSMRLTGNHGVIKNNFIEWSSGLKACPFPSWLIGIFYSDLTISKNIIKNIRTKEPGIQISIGNSRSQKRVFKNIIVTENTIIDSSYAGIFVSNCQNAIISGNTIKKCNYKKHVLRQHHFLPPKPFRSDVTELNYGIVVRSSDNIQMKNNSFINPGSYQKKEIHYTNN